MTESFFTIERPATGAYKERGSKFLAFAHPVTDSEQIKLMLDEIKAEYYDARHHCYAWVLGASKSQFKAFDDGEPNHSAGDPILNQIRSKNLTNILVVVVRYFGGSKLGLGGLTLAYKSAATDAIAHASIVQRFITKKIVLRYPYSQTSIIQLLKKQFDLIVIRESFHEECELQAEVLISKEEKLKEKLNTLNQQRSEIKIM